jgi:multidrug efflux system outer membrane protein
MPCLSSAQSVANTELTLDSAIKYALEYNLNLKKARIDLAASGYSVKKIWSEVFPRINATSGIGYSYTPLFGSDSIGNSGMNYSVGLGINLDLNGGIPFLMKSISLAHQGNILRYEDACNQLSIQVTKLFYSLIAEKNNLIFLEEVLDLAQRQFDRSQVSFRNGLVGELSVTQSRLAYENARFNFSSANISYSTNFAEFLAIIGIPSESGIILSGEISIKRISADAQTLINEYLHKRPDIVSSLQEIERFENARIQSQLQNRAPSLGLRVNWDSSDFSPFTDRLSANATLTIPLETWIPGTSRNQSVRRSNDSVEKAKLDLENTMNGAKTQIRSLTARLHNSWDSILIARLGFSAAQRRYQLTEYAFNNGTVESLALGDARNLMTEARQRLLQTELSYFNMMLDLSAAINVDWNYLVQVYGVESE